jgi:MATE family multidrug resistance protein
MSLIKNNLSPLLKLAIPLFFTGIAQSSAFFFQTVFLAHLGKDVLAAGALVSWLFATLSVIFFGALSSINVLVSHKHGAKDQLGIAAVLRDGLVMAILFSLPVLALCWNMSPIFLFFGQSDRVVSLAQAYLHALAWGVIPNFITIALLEFIIGLGHARTVMLFSIATVSLTLFFSYVLIFGALGFPSLGIAGAGWGIAIGDIAVCLLLVLYIPTQEYYKKYLQTLFRFNSHSYVRELLKIGLPMGFMYCVEVGFFFALTLSMGSFSTVFLAANQIAMQYLGFFMSLIFSMAQAITVRMGHLLGAKKPHLAEQAGYLGICISGLFMLFIALIFWFFPSYLISIDFDIHNPNNQELVYHATQLLMISPLFQILESVRISLFGVLRALKDTQFTLITSIFSFWLLSLPIGYFLATSLNLQGAGFWWGMVCGVSISVVLLLWRFKIKMKNYVH